ncbi:MAG TPA: hypothetical protein ENI52_02295 [Thermoplasmata archaeon]|nr:hypothetical protein [Thermoplasmata archaeon]
MQKIHQQKSTLEKTFPSIQWTHREGKGIAFLLEKKGHNESIVRNLNLPVSRLKGDIGKANTSL